MLDNWLSQSESSWSISGIVGAGVFEKVLFDFEFVLEFLLAKRAFGCWFLCAFFQVFFLLLQWDHLETALAVFELVFEQALFQIVFVQLWNLHDAGAVLTDGQHFAFLETVEVVQVVVLEVGVLEPTVVAHAAEAWVYGSRKGG